MPPKSRWWDGPLGSYGAARATHPIRQPEPQVKHHRKARKPSTRRPSQRDVKAALQGMLMAYNRLGDVLVGPELERVRSLFVTTVEVTGHQFDFPALARKILGWDQPSVMAMPTVDPTPDPSIQPPWET